jgi:hypothetical protein
MFPDTKEIKVNNYKKFHIEISEFFFLNLAANNFEHLLPDNVLF